MKLLSYSTDLTPASTASPVPPQGGRRDWMFTAGRAGLSAALAGVGLKAAAQSAPSESGNRAPGGHGSHSGPGGRGGPEGRGMMGERMLERLTQGLDLTPEQQTRLRALAQQAQSQFMAGQEPRRALRERGLAEWAKPQLDANAIEAIRVEHVKLHDEASRQMNALFTQAAAILSPTQRATVVQRMRDMPRGPGRMRGGMGGPGGMGPR